MLGGSISRIRFIAARISNFRSLKNVEVELNDLTLLVGANNSGKTSFLDALYGAIGAGRRTLAREDIYLAPDESDVPKDRASVIDILLRPTNDDGQVIDNFPAGDYWTNLFGDGISQDPIDFHDLVAIRTTLAWSSTQADYRVSRKFLKEWKQFDDWLSADEKEFVSNAQIEPIALHYIDAKRDLEEELHTRGSFWRRLTEDLGLSADDVKEFESALTTLNNGIIERSEVLKHLRDNLLDMERVISAEKTSIDVAPVARRLRDLSKGIDITFSTSGSQSFPLSRHGMGTRSFASLLVFRAFASWKEAKAREGGDSVHTLLALEEPEAHLHPQAQRALFSHIRDITGQRIVSTHSPYFAGQSRLEDARLFLRKDGSCDVKRFDLSQLKDDDRRKLEREVIASRGDVLFARALVLFEGETEEQALPVAACTYWGASIHELGFSFVAVRGQNYFPFVWLAKELTIPWYIFSDGEPATIQEVERQLGRAGTNLASNTNNIVILGGGNDFEAQLIVEGYLDAVEAALTSLFGPEFLDQYIKHLDGKDGRPIGGIPTKRNYSGADGRAKAAIDVMRERKTRVALSIAEAIAGLVNAKRRVPQCAKTLFRQMSGVFGLKAVEEP